MSELETPLDLVLHETRRLALETGGDRAARAVGPRASLDRDVGLGSLEKVELVSRIEQRGGVKLPDRILEAETCEEIAAAFPESATVPSARTRLQQDAVFDATFDTGPLHLATTVDRALMSRAEKSPFRVTIFLTEDDASERDITYSDLYRGASEIAAGLSARGIARGDTVALMLPTGFDFLRSFQGILLSGAVAVPIYPPARLDRLAEYAERHSAILRSAGVKIMITVSRAKPVAQVLKAGVPSLQEVATAGEIAAGRSATLRMTPRSRPEDPALIQYTSGSTGSPKGVLLTHANLMANVKAIGLGLEAREVEMGVSWLPLYHDMGLIGTWLFTMASGYPLALRSPLSFLARPERWLQDIHRRRGTLSAAPNFAYELCVRRIKDEDIEGIDLSSWKCALNGAEPVRPETIERFVGRFAKYGFRPEAMMPVFGLAECSVGLSFPKVLAGPRLDRVARAAFERGHAITAEKGDTQAAVFVSVGRALPEHEIKVVDSTGALRPEREVGRLLFKGPSMTAGYYRNEAATLGIRQEDGFLDTGDLAYVADNDLFITGRSKDLIIRGGRNLVAAEIEEAASEAPGVRKGCVAAFGVADLQMGTERVVVVAETRTQSPDERARIEADIIDRVTSATGGPPDVVKLVAPGSVLKTSSGKIRRSETKAVYLAGALGREKGDSWLTRLRLASLIGLDAARATEKRLSLGARALLLFGTLLAYAPIAWISLRLQKPKQARSFERASARLALRLLTPEVTLSAAEALHELSGAALFVSNHASYLDVIILRALVPSDFVFVAKREALAYPLVGSFLKRSGHICVERFDARRSAADAALVTQALNQGQRVMVFPEGTFTHADGIRPFRLGAFKAAADAGCPVVPVAIRGSRKMLRGEQIVPRRSSIRLWVGAPIAASGSSFRDLVALRDQTRRTIGAESGEVLLDMVSAEIPLE